jgi:hypothetical protein
MAKTIKNDSNTVVIEDGKYAVSGIETGRLEALRYGEPWRELVGDKLVLGLVQEIQRLRGDRSIPSERE